MADPSALAVETRVNLRALNTFALPAVAAHLVRVRSAAEVRRIVDDEHRVPEVFVDLALDEDLQESSIDAVLEAIHDLRVHVVQVAPALDTKLVVQGLVLRIIALEQPGVVLEHVHT